MIYKAFLHRSSRAFTAKIYANAIDATKDVPDRSVITCGGFGLCGIPENIFSAIRHHGQKKLTWISDDANNNDEGIGTLIEGDQIDKYIGSYIGPCTKMLKKHGEGKIGIQLMP